MAQSIWNPDEQFELDPNTGEYRQAPAPQLEYAGADAGGNAQFLADLEKQYGIKAGETDLANLNAKNPEDVSGFKSALATQFAQRASSNGPQQATAQYSSSASGGGAGDAALSQFMQMLQAQQSQQAQQQAALREILMGQLGQATQPVSVDAPGIREVLAGGRIGLQRGAERQRRDAAEMRAYDGSGGLGGKAFSSDVQGILQRQGEAEAQQAASVLGQELQGKRDQIQRLLSLAMQLGDAESARTLQAQLNAIQTQLQSSQFNASLGQNQSQFLDNMAFNYTNLNSNNNLQTLLALLNAA